MKPCATTPGGGWARYSRSQTDQLRNSSYTVAPPPRKVPQRTPLSSFPQWIIEQVERERRRLGIWTEEDEAQKYSTNRLQEGHEAQDTPEGSDALLPLFLPREAAEFYRVGATTMERWVISGKFVPYITTPSGQARFSQEQLETFLHANHPGMESEGHDSGNLNGKPTAPADLMSRNDAAQFLGVTSYTLSGWHIEQVFMPDLSTPVGGGWYSKARMRSLTRAEVLEIVKREREKYFDWEAHMRQKRRMSEMRRRWAETGI